MAARMQTSGTIPRGGLDVSDLAELLERPGPFATVYLGTDPSVDNAEQRSLQRWRAIRDRLAEEGAPATCLDAIEELVGPAHLVGEALAVVADESGVLLLDHHDEAIDEDRASWGPLPDLVPLLRWRQDHVPYVVVLADRGGADLMGERPGRRTIERTAGDGEAERKVKGGGWSHRRFQDRAEEDWAATAREVAAEATALADRIDARIIVLGGDVRARQLVLDGLPTHLADRVRLIEQGRALDGSDEERQREVRRLVATAVAEDSMALLDKFKEERGQHDRAADGPAATVAAVNQAAVEVLLVSDSQEQAWVTSAPVPVGLDEQTASVGRDDPPRQVPLAAALIRGAVGTGAQVRVVPAHGPVTGGIGALLRWSTPDA
jgi:hypothetical protein